MDPLERSREFLQETVERTCQGSRSGDDYVVEAGDGGRWEDGTRRLGQAPARPVTGHRLTNPAAHGKAQTNLLRRALTRTRPGLEHEGLGDPFPSGGADGKKLRAPFEPHHLGQGVVLG